VSFVCDFVFHFVHGYMVAQRVGQYLSNP